MFVPHYGDARFYVGPGFGQHNRTRYTADELLKAGCKDVTLYHWPAGSRPGQDLRDVLGGKVAA
jgi:hypothetical protein